MDAQYTTLLMNIFFTGEIVTMQSNCHEIWQVLCQQDHLVFLKDEFWRVMHADRVEHVGQMQ